MTKHFEAQHAVTSNIRRLREESGKTKTELCLSIGMSRAFWDDIENGNKEPSISTLERIATALGVTVTDLIESPKPKGKRSA
jgi:transcriptional regulator with XRE-family HTH domain